MSQAASKLKAHLSHFEKIAELAEKTRDKIKTGCKPVLAASETLTVVFSGPAGPSLP